MKMTDLTFSKCIKRTKDPEKEEACAKEIKDLKQLCLNSDIRSFKTIRLPMELIRRILKADPTIKIIYSTRDPRGMINSRKNLEKFTNTTFEKRVIDLCIHVEHDHRLFLKYRLVRRSSYQLNYDKLNIHLVEETKSIYRHLGIDIKNSSVIKQISELDRSKGEGKPSHVPKWKSTLTTDEVAVVNKECAWLMKTLGYDKYEGL